MTTTRSICCRRSSWPERAGAVAGTTSSATITTMSAAPRPSCPTMGPSPSCLPEDPLLPRAVRRQTRFHRTVTGPPGAPDARSAPGGALRVQRRTAGGRLRRAFGEGLPDVLRPGDLAVGLLGVGVGLRLVVDGLDVHGPDVVLGALDDVVDRAHRAEHRVVGVVVAVQAVAPDLDEVLAQRVQPAADALDAAGVLLVVDGVGERDAHYVAAADLLGRR